MSCRLRDYFCFRLFHWLCGMIHHSVPWFSCSQAVVWHSLISQHTLLGMVSFLILELLSLHNSAQLCHGRSMLLPSATHMGSCLGVVTLLYDLCTRLSFLWEMEEHMWRSAINSVWNWGHILNSEILGLFLWCTYSAWAVPSRDGPDLV